MSLKNRLDRAEKLGRLHAPKQRPATVERTADGEYYLLAPEGRTRIGDEAQFAAWQAQGHRVWAVIEGLTPAGSKMVQAIVAGQRTTKERK